MITELLHEILQYIAYENNILDQQDAASRRPTKDLVSFSSANRRMRGIALPLLFKHVQIDRVFKAKRLLRWCRSFPELSELVKYAINVLVLVSCFLISTPRIMRFDRLGHREDYWPEDAELWLQILASLPHLNSIEVGNYGYPNPRILEAMHNHSNVSKIFFNSFGQVPKEIHLSDLSKIMLKQYMPRKVASKTLFLYIARGMIVDELCIHKFHQYLSAEKEAIQVYNGLRKITLGPIDQGTCLSQLSRFISSHLRTLETIEFIGIGGHLDELPSISTFLQTLQAVDETGRVARGHNVRITLSRQSTATPSDSLQQFQVTGLYLHTGSSLYKILELVWKFIPNLERLELLSGCKETYQLVGYFPISSGHC